MRLSSGEKNSNLILSNNMQADSYIKSNNLTVSIVSVSQLEEATRIDSEYYKPEFMKPYRDNLVTKPIGDVLTNCQYGLSKDMNELGVGYEIYRMNDLKMGLCDDEDLKRADVSENVMRKYRLSKNDILFNRVNSIEFVGRTGIYKYSCDLNRIFASYLIRLNTDEVQVLPDYLNMFLNCKFGVKQIKRKARQAVNQANVNAEELKRIAIPIASNFFQQKIAVLSESAFELRDNSKKISFEVNKMLLSHLGFADFIPSTVNYSSRSSKEATDANRLDGEYWLPMYDEIEKKIAEYPHGYDAFDKLIEVSSETISPNADETYKYAELSNVVASIGLIEDASEICGNELPSRARMKLRKDDVVLSSVEGSADKVAIVKVESDNLVGSTGFFVLRKKALLPEVILALLRIPHINAIYKRQAQGTILTAVPRNSLSRIMLPKIPELFQQEIVSQVQEAHNLHIESKRLLEVAKRAVEIFIEQDEDAGMEYIKQNYEQV